MKIERSFTIFYIILAVSEVLAEITGNYTLVYITKPLLVISLISYFLYSTQGIAGFADKNFFVVALLFALLGDVFLMIRGQDLFIPGLGSFLLMQWLYIFVFGKKMKQTIFTSRSLLTLLPFLIYAALLFFLIAKKLTGPVLKCAIGVYALSISIMAWTAFLGIKSAPSRNLIFIGALLFLLSDSLIAVGRFLSPVPMQDLLVMGTYAAAQILITTGLIKANQAG
jgi:uncharacterized membrane protein YhhN